MSQFPPPGPPGGAGDSKGRPDKAADQHYDQPQGNSYSYTRSHRGAHSKSGAHNSPRDETGGPL